MKKRLFSIVLTLCMVLALMPQMVFAEEPGNYDELQGIMNDARHGGTVTLTKDYTINNTVTVYETTLDLNGHVITMTGNGSVIKVDYSDNFTLQDSSEGKTGVITSDTGSGPGFGGGVYVDADGSFTMNGGIIYDCYAQSGGGVFVRNGGSFTMNNGAISGCNAHVLGGGVCVDAGGSFTMNGGTIYNCSSLDGGGVNNGGTLYANGGTIRDSVYNMGLIENANTDGCTVFYGGINIVNSGTINGKKVTFKKDDSTYAIEIVAEGKTAAVPTEPRKEDYKFTGWYTDEALNNLYNFDMPVDDELILYAGWDEEIITLTVPFTTTVKLDGSASPGETTFNLQVLDSSGEKLSSGDVIIETTSVKTNGEGDYDGTLKIKGTSEDIAEMLMDGVFVKQAEGKYTNWEVDDTVWGLVWKDAVVALASADSAATDNSIFIFPAEYVETENGGYYEMVEGEEAVDKMTFINTYTKSATGPSDSDDTNGDAVNADKNAKTGDDTNLALWLALMILAGAGIAGTTIYARRKRTNE